MSYYKPPESSYQTSSLSRTYRQNHLGRTSTSYGLAEVKVLYTVAGPEYAKELA